MSIKIVSQLIIWYIYYKYINKWGVLMALLETEIKEELSRIIEKYGLFNSSHEFDGVLREELDEVYDEVTKMAELQMVIWGKIKKDGDFQEDVKKLDDTVNSLIKELIQVKAVLMKLDKSTY